MRDVVAWRCVRLSGADSEDVYIAALDNAFDGGLSGDKDLKSQLLNSFHHVLGGDPNAFKSHSSQRRRRRPRKSRTSPRGSSAEPAPAQHGGGVGGDGVWHGQAGRARSAEPMAGQHAGWGHHMAAGGAGVGVGGGGGGGFVPDGGGGRFHMPDEMAGQQMWMPFNPPPTMAWDYQAPADAVWPCAVGCVASASSAAPADLMMADASVSAAAAAVDPGVAASHAAFHGGHFDDAAAYRGRAPSPWATAQRRAISGGGQAIAYRHPAVTAPAQEQQQVFPTVPPGCVRAGSNFALQATSADRGIPGLLPGSRRRDGTSADPRKLVSVRDEETGVATLQFAPAAAEQAEDPRAGRLLEEAPPRQPVQDATKCQECGGHDPNGGWQDRQNRFYCARCWKQWRDDANETRTKADEAPPRPPRHVRADADRVTVMRKADPIQMADQSRRRTELLVMPECGVSVVQLLRHGAKHGDHVCLVAIGCSGCLDRSSNDSGLHKSMLSRTDFEAVFPEDPDMAPQRRDALFAEDVKVSKGSCGEAIEPFRIPVVYVLAPPKPSEARSDSKRFRDEMKTKVLDIARVCHKLGFMDLVLASTFEGLPARSVAALLRCLLLPQAIGALMGGH